MKTPQEEAEEMAARFADDVLLDGWCEPFKSTVKSGYIKTLLSEIPLTELIAVARAAEELNSNCIPATMGFDNNRSYVYTCDSDKLESALQALRATEKVEL